MSFIIASIIVYSARMYDTRCTLSVGKCGEHCASISQGSKQHINKVVYTATIREWKKRISGWIERQEPFEKWLRQLLPLLVQFDRLSGGKDGNCSKRQWANVVWLCRVCFCVCMCCFSCTFRHSLPLILCSNMAFCAEPMHYVLFTAASHFIYLWMLLD